MILDESPNIRGRPAVAVMLTFYDPALPGRSTHMLALKVLLQCNALMMAMLLQEVLLKFDKWLNDVSMLVSDSAPYMRKLYLDLCQSNLEFAGVHLSNPCHLLNDALTESLHLERFACMHDFVIHVTAMLKSSKSSGVNSTQCASPWTWRRSFLQPFALPEGSLSTSHCVMFLPTGAPFLLHEKL